MRRNGDEYFENDPIVATDNQNLLADMTKYCGVFRRAVIDRKERRIGKSVLVFGVIVRAGRRARSTNGISL